MKRILLRVAYDGTDFHGWQFQPGVRTVEGELNNAITLLTGKETEVTGASRTDAGVHAMGNVAVFDTEATVPPERFAQALNTYLPEDV
jgi:Pseudouridylate synthase